MSADLADLARSWRRAEERLYPIVLVEPDHYARYVKLVRATADHLATCASVEQLAEAHARRGAYVAAAAQGLGVRAGEVDDELVAGAAFNLRYRELVGEAERDQALARIREAAGAVGWVVLHERGHHEAPGYRRLEMHLPGGDGLLVSVDMSPDTGGLLYSVQPMRLDPGTGDPLTASEHVSAPETYESAQPWRDAVARLRRLPEADG